MISKPVVFSGSQPSGRLTIGNYVGAIRQWVDMQKDYNCIFCIVDLHAIVTRQDLYSLHTKSLDTLALYLACGIDPNISTIFVQSHVPEHTQLSWILNSCTYFGELKRMIQFKEKSNQFRNKLNIGLFNYPVLMAADILLYKTDLVPVGSDQRQHIELTCDIAKRFNYKYGTVFTIPKMLSSKFGSRIMSLLNPTKKMSKSDTNPDNYITLLDGISVISRKITRAITDSDEPPKICYDPVRKPGVSNLLSILSSFSGKSVYHLEEKFKDKTYFQLKSAVIDSMSVVLNQLQHRYNKERFNEGNLNNILSDGAKKAKKQANLFLKEVYKVLGF